ncbi:hypothetical protein [Neptunitalea lumnitzerae]|uniref:C1q domain-containing protein n=1 Tax=Neptunitalea lumnitzerae TaxID=2965509 RepID=A0ABQ5MFB3_9FLAO|nr:hypothetical protein [Neptunitalea sp. Y10]GLB48096.1 hypothetical protein Y10_04640 [Neptunitalea sp. Y10]
MKKIITCIGLFITTCLTVTAQVGIDTTDPLATLDVNGDLRIVDTPQGSTAAAADSILVVNGNGFVKRVSAEDVYYSSVRTAAKGGLTSSLALVNASVLTWKKLQFTNIVFDTKGQYDTVNHVFDIDKAGIYKIYLQYKYVTSGLSISLIPYIAIRKNGVAIATSSPVLSLNEYMVATTMVELSPGDEISFYYGTTLSLGIGGSATISNSIQDTYFTVEQIN